MKIFRKPLAWAMVLGCVAQATCLTMFWAESQAKTSETPNAPKAAPSETHEFSLGKLNCDNSVTPDMSWKINAEVFALVDKASQAKFEEAYREHRRRIDESIGSVFRSATQFELLEPGLVTLKHRLEHVLSDHLGEDSHVVHGVLIPNMQVE